MKRIVNWLLTLLLMLSFLTIEAQTTYETISDANFRKGPGARFKSLGIIKAGEKINVYNVTNPAWYKVEYNGKLGFVASKFLSQKLPQPVAEIIPAKQVMEPEKPKTGALWAIGMFIAIAIFFYSRRKRKKKDTQSVIQQTQAPKIQTTIPSKSLGKNQPKVVPEVKTQAKEDKPVIMVLTELNSTIQASSEIKLDSQSKETIKSSPDNEELVAKVNTQEKKADSSITHTKDSNFNIQANLPIQSNYKPKEPIKSNTDNEQIIARSKSTQEKEEDPTIIEVNSLGYSVQIKIAIETDNLSKRSINSDPDNEQKKYTYADNLHDGNYWGLGTKYQEKLNLTHEQVDILNKQWAASNNFCSIESCCEEVVKFFVSTLRSLNETLLKENNTLSQQITAVVDTVLRKHFRYQLNSFNYKSSIDSATNEIFTTLFKYCENTVRAHYGHKRKLNIDTYFASTAAAQTEFETRIITPLNNVLHTLISTIATPNEETEIELNAQNTSRWKDKFEQITEKHKDNPTIFLDHIIKLGILNKENPSIENIFFEASKFIAKTDKEIALTLYTHYLYHDLKSATFDNKQLTKTIQKNIFKTNDQLKAFEVILSDLIQDKNLEKALKGIPEIFSVKRKKIKLDTASIEEVQLQHSGTVELLNEYLKDEYEDENNSIKTQESGNGELTIQITSKLEIEQKSIYTNDLSFSTVHIEVLEIFTKSNFSVVKKELEITLKPKGFFVNQIVENINEISYECLDDILIEEEDDCLTINPDYYKRILVK
jgi:uncharacterized protein YgiM (DUF1202 family)